MSTMRERTFSWSDPREVARHVMTRPHLEWMNAMVAGEIPPPPFAEALDLRFDHAELGRVIFSAYTHEWISNPVGTIHGGFIATVLDSVLTLAVQTNLPDDRSATTVDLHVQYVRPLFVGSGRIVAEGLALHVGSTLATAEGRLTDERGKLIAHATGTFAIIAPQGSRPVPADS